MSASTDYERLQRVLGGDALSGLRRRLRRRYAKSTPPLDGFTLNPLDTIERDALAGLLGRKRGVATTMRLSHAELDRALQAAGLATDLRGALEDLDGPIVDSAARRERERRRWATVVEALPAGPLAEAFADTADQGLLKRLSNNDCDQAGRLLDQAQRVLARLPAAGVTLSRLAAETLGDAHGLDTSRPVATILRRALDPDRRMQRMRDVWAQQGVLVGELAKPVAVFNLATCGNDAADRLLVAARSAGEPLHLSLRLLLRTPPDWERDQPVYVCENPDVVAAAANALGPNCPAMVSLDGQLSAAPRTLLDQLRDAGCALYYHGDFDWPGLAIGNGIISRYGAVPWRYSAADYAPARGVVLSGEPVDALWDAELAPAMQAAGVAVHEEAQLSILLNDLGARWNTSVTECE